MSLASSATSSKAVLRFEGVAGSRLKGFSQLDSLLNKNLPLDEGLSASRMLLAAKLHQGFTRGWWVSSMAVAGSSSVTDDMRC